MDLLQLLKLQENAYLKTKTCNYNRPFQVGDKFQVGDHYGEVISIGLRSSQFETPDESMVYIPYGKLKNRAVSNTNSSALDCQVLT